MDRDPQRQSTARRLGMGLTGAGLTVAVGYASLFAVFAVGFGVCGSDTNPAPEPGEPGYDFCNGDLNDVWTAVLALVPAPAVLIGTGVGIATSRWQPLWKGVAVAICVLAGFLAGAQVLFT